MIKSQGLLFAAASLLFLPIPSHSSGDDQSTKHADTSAEKGDQTKKQRKVYTNEDLERLKETTPINQAPAKQESREPKKSHKAEGVEGYRDSHGHDRTYWQQKIRPLRKQLESLDSQIAALQTKQGKMSPLNGVKVSRSGRLQASSDTRAQLTKRIDDLTAKKGETLRSIRDVEEDARKSQALPEWLR